MAMSRMSGPDTVRLDFGALAKVWNMPSKNGLFGGLFNKARGQTNARCLMLSLLDKLRFLQLWWAIKGGVHVKIHVTGYLEKGTTTMSPKRCLKTCTHSSHYHVWRQEALDLGRIVACLQERHFPISTNLAYPTSLDVNRVEKKTRSRRQMGACAVLLGVEDMPPVKPEAHFYKMAMLSIMFYPPWT